MHRLRGAGALAGDPGEVFPAPDSVLTPILLEGRSCYKISRWRRSGALPRRHVGALFREPPIVPMLLQTPPQRFDDKAQWTESISAAFVPLDVDVPRHTRFQSTAATESLGWMQISELRTNAQVVRRSRPLAARSEAAMYKLTLQLRQRSEIRQCSRAALLMPGQWTIYDTTMPYEVSVDDDAHFLVLKIPGEHLSAWQPYIRNALARPFSTQQGCGRMAMQLLRLSLQEQSGLTHNARQLAASSILHMLGLHLSEAQCDPALQQPWRQAQLIQMQQHILEHLHDPELSPASVAASFRVSRRYLYGLFQQAGMTPSDFILNSRLTRCRDALREPALAAHSIGHIAGQYGFVDAAGFSRVFRRCYGVSPSQWRKEAPRH